LDIYSTASVLAAENCANIGHFCCLSLCLVCKIKEIYLSCNFVFHSKYLNNYKPNASSLLYICTIRYQDQSSRCKVKQKSTALRATGREGLEYFEKLSIPHFVDSQVTEVGKFDGLRRHSCFTPHKNYCSATGTHF
jgi:hypothetical protein